MKNTALSSTELILHPNGSVFHLHLKSEHIADTVFLVGNQDRVELISKHFDKLEHAVENREFKTHTGFIGKKRLTALSTGIGTDNIDIVLNELFAAVNINPQTSVLNGNMRELQLIRLGTSGALHKDIDLGTQVLASHGLGLDGLVHYYHPTFNDEELELQKSFMNAIPWPENLAKPYFSSGSPPLLEKLSPGTLPGITASAIGFYGPQGRNILGRNNMLPLQELFSSFRHKEHRITNFDMETSALYGLSKLCGFEACTINVVIANRAAKTMSKNTSVLINKMIAEVLAKVT